MQTIDEVKQHCRFEAMAVAIALGGIALVACGSKAVTTNDSASVRSSGKQAADVRPKEKRVPESEHSKQEREKRLKMILLSFGGEANTNNITFSDLDLTGWEAEEKKGEEALMLFLEKVWERADAKKIAEKRKCSKGRARLTK